MISLDKLPNFFIIGASKAGSTSLHHYLNQHPQISMASDKEPGFFQKDDDYKKGLEWYSRTYFSGAKNTAIGESTASYLYYTRVAERLHELPDENQRFIISLRDPIERAYSQYWHQVRIGEYRSFKDAIREEIKLIESNEDILFDFPPKTHYLGRSLYSKHLNNYLRYFDRTQFKIIFLEHLKADPQKAINQITDFLEIDRYENISTSMVHNYGVTNVNLIKLNAFKNSSFYRKYLRKLLPPDLRRVLYSSQKVILNKAKIGKTKYPPIDKDSKIYLKEFFSEDVKNLKLFFQQNEDRPNWINDY